jgi:hypothetical protein
MSVGTPLVIPTVGTSMGTDLRKGAKYRLEADTPDCTHQST